MSNPYEIIAERLASRPAEWAALFREFGPRINGPSKGHRMSQRDFDRGWFLRDEITRLTRHKRALERAGATGGGTRSGDYDRDVVKEPDSVEDGRFRDPWDLRGVRLFAREPGKVAAELRSRALSAIERMPCANDKIRATATGIVERSDGTDSKLERHVLLTSRPAYVRAWSKLMNNKPHSLTPDERQAFSAVQEHRALTTTDVQSGYLIPFQLDSVLIIASAFVRSDLRQAANVVVATSDVWQGVSSQNVQYSFQAEGSEVADNATPFGQPSIATWMARGFIPISIEALGDVAANATQEIGRLLANGRLDLEAVKFVQGKGVGEPVGIVTALSQSSNSGSVVTTASPGVFALADLAALQAALPAHYRAAASFLSNNLIFNKIRQFDVSGGASFWSNLNSDRPPQLYNRDALEAEAMSGVVASGNKILIFGDLAQFYIVDHIGGQITELVPMLFNTSHDRPSGQRGWFSYFRCGSDLVNSVGVRCLSIQ